MNRICTTAIATLGLLLAAPLQAADPSGLARDKGCLACHGVDKKIVGPGFNEIAAKYKADDAATLAKRIKMGSTGVWGPVPMPPNAAISDDDAMTLVKWIMTH